ncbi:hypothetical protein BJ170DRAFT_691435 [Xylariales sp. AK1849]|nr:hypothetical protein BJ170DRAFT_691435 [Xylariales sp. AK1849]
MPPPQASIRQVRCWISRILELCKLLSMPAAAAATATELNIVTLTGRKLYSDYDDQENLGLYFRSLATKPASISASYANLLANDILEAKETNEYRRLHPHTEEYTDSTLGYIVVLITIVGGLTILVLLALMIRFVYDRIAQMEWAL